MSWDWPVKKIFIVAEAGVNHNGKLGTALKLIDAAKRAGCDAIKFQTYRSEYLASGESKLAAYQKHDGLKKIEGQFGLLQKYELKFDDFRILKKYCDKRKIIFLSTPFDEACSDFLERLGVPFFKISSGDLTNYPLLLHIGRKGRGVVLSTGMSTLKEVKQAVHTLKQARCSQVALLQCVTEYPASEAEVNLNAMVTLRKVFGLPVGFSDHTTGIEVAVAAAALGAKIIEKHLTLDRRMKGPDHRASLDPKNFAYLVRCLRNIEVALGDGIKRPSKSERKNIPVVRRSIVAAQPILQGKRIHRLQLMIKRPGYGIQPKDFEKVVGRRARCNLRKDTVIKWEHLK